jgi:hypothetical protein
MLWTGKVGGLWMALAILPIEFFYWIGFALPFGPVLGVARTALSRTDGPCLHPGFPIGGVR